MISRILLLAVALFMTSCASLMYSETAVSGVESLKLKQGDSVKLKLAIDPAVSEAIDERVGVANFKSMMKDQIAATFKEEGINVNDKAKKTLTVTVKNFAQGNHFCRAIGLSAWGLGGSFLEAEIDLKAGKKRRKFELEKTGQKSGLFNIPDQTNENIEYLAEKLAGTIK